MVKRGIVETLLRGIDNTIANWPVIVVRLGESVVVTLTALGAAVAILVPILVSLGVQLAEIRTPEQVIDALSAIAAGWVVLLWVLLAVSVLLGVFVAMHSFVVAGCVRIAVDADRAAGPAEKGPRTRFQAFTMSRWMAGAIEGWWAVFGIYNVAWGLAGLVLLIPLLPTGVLLLLLQSGDHPGPGIAVGCFGLAVTLFLGIATAIVTSIWTNRAIAGWSSKRESVRDALRRAWRALRSDVARHALIALAVFVVAGAGSSFFASISMVASIGESMGKSPIVNLSFSPFRVFSWVLSSAFSAAVTTWFLASYVALENE